MNSIEEEIQRQKDAGFFRKIKKILNKNSHLFTDFIEATPKQDMEEGFDAIFTFSDIKIPIRIRKHYSKKWMDFTIRSKNNGYKTEIHKIKEGAGDFYFYCWETYNERSISCYTIIDLDRFRETGIVNDPDTKHKPNGDGTCFHYWDLRRLRINDILLIFECLIQDEL